jgi:hypothetical protein
MATRPARLRLMLLIIALVPVTVWWIERAVDAPENGWFEGTTTFGVASDFSVFYTSGKLVASGDIGALYDVDRFQAAFLEHGLGERSDNSALGNPPVLALAVAPLTVLSVERAWYVWTALGLVLMAASLRVFGAPRPIALSLLALLTLPVYFAITFGQMSLFVLAAFALVYKELRSGRVFGAGLAASLLILKPTMLVGFLLWWAIDARHRRALAGLALGSAAIVAASLPFVGSAWLAWPQGVVDFARVNTSHMAQWGQFAPFRFFGILLPGWGAVTAVLGAAAVIGGLLVFRRLAKLHRRDVHVLFALAVLLNLWCSPQVLTYSWTLLLAVGVVLWSQHPELRAPVAVAGAALGIAAPTSVLLVTELLDSTGWALQLAVPALALSTWFVLWLPARRGIADALVGARPV